MKPASLLSLFIAKFSESSNYYTLWNIVLWVAEELYAYPAIILILTLITTGREIKSQWQSEKAQAKRHKTVKVKVFRIKDSKSGEMVQYSEEIDSNQLVPGDVFEVPSNGFFPCDAVVLIGSALVDENDLVGLSADQYKTALPSDGKLFDETQRDHIIYGGSRVIVSQGQVREDKAIAIVYQIGFYSEIGTWARSMMYGEPTIYRFERDSHYFTIYLVAVSWALMIAYWIYAGIYLYGPVILK